MRAEISMDSILSGAQLWRSSMTGIGRRAGRCGGRTVGEPGANRKAHAEFGEGDPETPALTAS